jgi:hypothetical protein
VPASTGTTHPAFIAPSCSRIAMIARLPEVGLGILMNVGCVDQGELIHPLVTAVLGIQQNSWPVVQLQLISENDIVGAVTKLAESIARVKVLKYPKEPRRIKRCAASSFHM